MTFLIVDPWQSFVCFIRSVVTRTLVHLCSASLQNLAVQQDFYSLLGVPVDDLANPVFDGVGLAGFKSRANASLLA